MKTISLKILKALRACAKGIAGFEKLFGTSEVNITLENCLKAAPLAQFKWLAGELLDKEALKSYQEAVATTRKAYDESITPAWKVYDEVLVPARKAYDEANATAWKAYQEAVAPALKVYDKSKAKARKAYKEAEAISFFNAWSKQEHRHENIVSKNT